MDRFSKNKIVSYVVKQTARFSPIWIESVGNDDGLERNACYFLLNRWLNDNHLDSAFIEKTTRPAHISLLLSLFPLSLEALEELLDELSKCPSVRSTLPQNQYFCPWSNKAEIYTWTINVDLPQCVLLLLAPQPFKNSHFVLPLRIVVVVVFLIWAPPWPWRRLWLLAISTSFPRLA